VVCLGWAEHREAQQSLLLIIEVCWASLHSAQPCMFAFWYKRDVFIIVVRGNKKGSGRSSQP
jgi:hypothetical protein